MMNAPKNNADSASRRTRLLHACAAVAITVGCGDSHGINVATSDAGAGAADTGSSAEAGSTNPTIMTSCGDPYRPIDPTAILDDMEDGNSVGATIGGRNGSWWAGGDPTPGGSIQPNGEAIPETIPGGRCGSRRAMHVTGHGFSDWGATLSLSLRYGTNDAGVLGMLPDDAHFRTGITFWARIGDTSTNQIRVAIADQHARPEAGICIVDGPPHQTCYDTFGVDVTQLDTTWKLFQIPFAGLAQRDFGVYAPTLDTSQLYDIEFAFYAGRVFDLWVDDISFY